MVTPFDSKRSLISLSTLVNEFVVTLPTDPCQPVAVMPVPLVSMTLWLTVNNESSPSTVNAERAYWMVLWLTSRLEPPLQTMAPDEPPAFAPPPQDAALTKSLLLPLAAAKYLPW